MKFVDVGRLCIIAEVEFADIVTSVDVTEHAMRIFLMDSSFIDVWFSLKMLDRYSYHWERRSLDGTIYWYDNAPHIKWQDVTTFPHHFHNGHAAKVVASDLSLEPEIAFRPFLSFAQMKLRGNE
ncbi:hypothetical protein GC175_31260 [bacterium]|nr:hypothetical protein [bacterium]